MTGIPTAALIACAVIVLALGALLSAGESALLRFTRAAADDLIEEGRRGATRVRRLAEHRTRVLGALSVARVAVDMLAAVLITLAASGLVRAWWQVLALALLANIILLGVVVGFSPRTYGRRNPAATLLALGGLLTWVDVLAAPQRRLVSRTRRPESAPTDVMSFPMDELRPGSADSPTPAGTLGDIVLCPQVAAKQALAAGHSAVEEMLLLTVHGILHLLGYDHAEPEEKKEMFDLQRRLLLTFLAERGK